MKQNNDLIGLAILKGLVKVNKHHTLYFPGEIGVAAMKRDAEIIHDEVNSALDKLDRARREFDRGGAERE